MGELKWEQFDQISKDESKRFTGCIIDNLNLKESLSQPDFRDLTALSELWTKHSLIIVRGDNKVSLEDEFRLCQLYYIAQMRIEGSVSSESDEAVTKLQETLNLWRQSQEENSRLARECDESHLKITHIQEDLEMEKTKHAHYAEQIASLHELEEYSSGLREECSRLEDTINDFRTRYADLERSFASINTMTNELRLEKNRLVKELQEKDLKIEVLERELWSLQVNRPSSLGSPPSSAGKSVGDVSAPPPLPQASQGDVAEPHDSSSTSSPPRKQKISQNETVFVNHEGGTDSLCICPDSDRVRAGAGERESACRSLQTMEEQNRRLASRLKFLDSRLHAKEESIKKLTSRIEEVAIERDSFREAMKDMLVGMGADKEVPNDPPRPATDLHASSTAHTTAEGTTLQNLKGVMGSFLTTASPPTGTGIGSVANTPSSPSAIANLDGEIKRLRKEVKATEELKKRLEEVERQLEQAESAAKDAENWADEEFETLTSQVESANKDRDDVYEKLEAAKVEMDRLQKQISRGAAKVSQSEEKTHALQSRIDTLEREMRETQLSAINPEDFKAAQDKVQELLGESKHWQQKALSLSKEMQRSMSIQLELNRVQQELQTVKSRMEELEAERAAFREAMQQAISITSSDATTPVKASSSSAKGHSPGGWLRNMI